MQPVTHQPPNVSVRRVRFIYALIAVVMGIFLVRAFYLQIIRHDFYRKAALADQLKQQEIPAERGIILAHSGDKTVPIVLNQKLYTIFVDPTMVKTNDVDRDAAMLASVLGGEVNSYAKAMRTPDTSYVEVYKRVESDKKDSIMKHKYQGIGQKEMTYRIYPNGSLASQVLGFVNADGHGVYGLEQALDTKLRGTAGQLKAVTDINGVPLAANTDNIQIAPQAGDDLVLTVDMPMQQQLEHILQEGLKKAKSDSGSAVILEANTGAVKAMANWPTYDPSTYGTVENSADFEDPAVSSPLEVGSVMKPLTTAAALDAGAVKADQTYYDPASWKVDDFTIRNIEEDGGGGVKSLKDVLNLSLNTGATWLLMQMSKPGGTDINAHGRQVWYDYMTKHYMFGKETGIEVYETPGYIPDPNKGYARDLTYANTTFGQGMTATPLQMAAAFAAIVNGGTYYQPHLVDATVSNTGDKHTLAPKILNHDVVSPQVSKDLRSMLEFVVDKHYFTPGFNQQQYGVGGKTGTAQIEENGKYLEHDFNGTYLGYVGGDTPQYVIMVRANKPKVGGYAGTAAAQPIFGSLAHMLIDNFNVTPKGQ